MSLLVCPNRLTSPSPVLVNFENEERNYTKNPSKVKKGLVVIGGGRRRKGRMEVVV